MARNNGEKEFSGVQSAEFFYRKAVQSFLKSDVTCLLKSMDSEEKVQCREELLIILQAAGDLAARLWTQKTQMVFNDGPRLLREKSSFSINSPSMEAHRSMGCDNENHDFDGYLIDLVLVPGVIAYGNREGEMYGSYKIWMKSTVLVLAGGVSPAQTDSEGASQQDKRNLKGRRSTPINVEDSDRPTKKIKTEKENEQSLPAATATTNPATVTPPTNLRAHCTQKSSNSDPQKLSVCVPKKPSPPKRSTSGLQCTPAATFQEPQSEIRSPAPKLETGAGTSGSLADASSKPPPTHVRSMSGMQQPEADTKPQSRYQKPGKHSLPKHSEKLATTRTATKTPKQRRRQMRKQKKKDATRKHKRDESKLMRQHGQTNQQVSQGSRANQSKK